MIIRVNFPLHFSKEPRTALIKFLLFIWFFGRNFMLKNWIWVVSFFSAIGLIACGGDSGSSVENSEGDDEEFAARCYERFGFDADSPWSTSLSGNTFLESYVCDGLNSYMSSSLSFYAMCTSAEYNEAKNRYDIEIVSDQNNFNIWAEVSGCKYKYGTDGDLESMVSNMNERILDLCICKSIDGEINYRDFSPNSEASSSSANEIFYSSSSFVSSSSAGKRSSTSADIVKSCDECNAFKDSRDGNIYRVTEIDGMVWMSEDLRYYDPDLEFAYYIRCGSTNGCEDHGYLYSFAAAMNNADCGLYSTCGDKIQYPHQGLCPQGFHIPEYWEWEQLYDYINENRYNETYFNNEVHLRAVEGWSYPGDDLYGFSAVPTGEFSYGSIFMDEYARYWTSTEYGSESAYEWYLGDLEGLRYQTYLKNFGYAIRCVADGKVKLTEIKEWNIPSSSSEFSSSSEEFSSSSSEYSSSSEKSSSSIAYSYSYTTVKIPDCETCNAFTDKRDGMIYRVQKISGEIWMIDDLRYSGAEGLPLDGAYCASEDGCTKKGRLYTFDAAREACPEGFELPSNSQMSTLIQNHVGTYYDTCEKLDALLSGNGEWGKPCGNASGFSAVPTGEWGDYAYKSDSYARYWTSTEVNSTNAYMWYISATSAFTNQTYKKSFGYAVRCVATADVILDEIVE